MRSVKVDVDVHLSCEDPALLPLSPKFVVCVCCPYADVKGDVDVDLSCEDPAGKVSRRQAYLTLDASGQFTLMNAGQRLMIVDGREVSLRQV